MLAYTSVLIFSVLKTLKLTLAHTNTHILFTNITHTKHTYKHTCTHTNSHTLKNAHTTHINYTYTLSSVCVSVND